MGICSSCESTNVATVKVILHDGRLQEFAYPIRVSQVLEKNPRSFVCNMDEMDFDIFISAINAEEELQQGRLYFALPMSWLKSPLSGEKMVSLAAKASMALKTMSSTGGSGRCGCGKKDDFMVDIINSIVSDSTSPKIAVGGGRTVGGHHGGSMPERKDRAGGGGRGRGGKHTEKLSAILEE
ncbi:HTH-type transcriptional regulator [Melia azedarach]|uniref:HTH-type transcriptional regulator n=1 Tax=Melia azedarach TaxID=155640 RepID=A0ACC1XYH0_MELAZ|nr:HTH-type transcriptional regulator [Melia azedarach]